MEGIRYGDGSAKDIKVVNIGLTSFYYEMILQGVKATQIEWQPRPKQNAEIESLLDDLL